ncbi:hypothetical protein AJ79_09221 [Helicocarpus griseus UAMH5409]|uniref:LCCL domain-containing protein n=1 Tax=Helicocarpus griseus UAMH5409 TaxID=1447875 RepID=A0A2B7WLD9_9EURO|nr:hypothetical protein AJ79_09221 [Helicocarpus griseus UAMH5409]
MTWVILFILILLKSSSPSGIGGYGAPVKLSCTSKLWPDATHCGLDGLNCLPFDNHSFAFSCPANCLQVNVLNLYTIGDKEINYQTLVVGGGPSNSSDNTSSDRIYRGDSFICGAALHAGIFANEKGGCGIVSRRGEQSNYQGINRNGITSVGFNSTFPLSFTFLGEGESRTSQNCEDPRWKLLAVSVIFTSLISMFSTSPAAFFVPICVIVYFQVFLASDPPPFPDYDSGLSYAAGRFLPAAFVGFFVYKYCVRYTLCDLDAPLEKTLFWLSACWVGALSNYTLDEIPIQRLTPHDIRQQPGAIPALIIIVLIIFAIALSQAWAFRIEGRMPRYLALYGILIVSLLLLVAIPGQNLRIHHYILSLLLLPGTSLQTRPSLLYQGLLVGLFINGVARWGFDSILQTPAALLDDGKQGNPLPRITSPVINSDNITFAWENLPVGYEGVIILVNDVQRFLGFSADGNTSFTWTRRAAQFPEYFRFAFVKYLPLGHFSVGDYTKAGIWEPGGSWIPMQPGPS